MKEQFKINFAKRLNDIIESQQRSRSEVAQAAGIKYPTLASYLNTNGTGALPPLDIAVRLADTLGVSLDELCGQNMLPSTTPPKATSLVSEQTAKESEVQTLLRTVCSVAKALNMSVGVEDHRVAVLKSENHFLRLFFEQIMGDTDLDETLGLFADVKLLDGELLDPITYQIAKSKEKDL